MKTKWFIIITAALFALAQFSRAQDMDSLTPVVVKTVPEAGTKNVPPGEYEIKVTFSKEMADGSWSWSSSWKDSTPESVGKPKYETDHKTCVMKVRLEAGKTYGYWLNSEKFHNFKDTQGHPAVPYLLVFHVSGTQDVTPVGKSQKSRLQFRLVADANDTAPAEMLDDPGSKQPLRICKEVLLDETAVANASMTISPDNKASVTVDFNEAGARRFAEITGANIGKRLAVVFDGKLLSAPTIRTVIHDKAIITGNFTATEVAETIAKIINAQKLKPAIGEKIER